MSRSLSQARENPSDFPHPSTGVLRKLRTPADPLTRFVEILECCRGRRASSIHVLQGSAVVTIGQIKCHFFWLKLDNRLSGGYLAATK